SGAKNPSRQAVLPIEPKMLPFIPADDLKEYLLTPDSTPDDYKKAVEKARTDLLNLPKLDAKPDPLSPFLGEEELLALAPPMKDADYSRKLDDRGKDFGHRQFLL